MSEYEGHEAEHEEPTGPQEIQLQGLSLSISTTEQHVGADWVAYAVATALPVAANNVDWSLNPTFGIDGDEGRTAIV